MLQTMIRTLPSAARVTERLVAQFGADQVWQVQQLSEHIYRALLNDGAVAFATVREDGEIDVRELEAVW